MQVCLQVAQKGFMGIQFPHQVDIKNGFVCQNCSIFTMSKTDRQILRQKVGILDHVLSYKNTIVCFYY